jgi:pterin-4a-carbinolamine dehydratase
MTQTEIDFLTGLTEAHGIQIAKNAKNEAGREHTFPRYTTTWSKFRKMTAAMQQLVIEHPEVQLSAENFKFIWNTQKLV